MNPWEKYQAPVSGPWAKYGTQEQPAPLKVGPPVNNTPIEVEPIYGDSGVVINMKEIQEGKAGRSFAPKLPPSLSPSKLAEISMSAGPQYTANYIGPKIKQDIAPDEPYDWQDLVQVDSDNVYYLDLKTKSNPSGTGRWVKVPAFNVAGAAKTVGEVGGYMGGVALAGKTAAPVPSMLAGAAGAGLAAGAGEVARLGLGRTFGINEGLPNKDIAVQGLKEGASTAAFSLGGDLALQHLGRRWGPRGDYFFNPKAEDNIFTGTVDDAGVRQVQGDAAVERVRKLHAEAADAGRAGPNADEVYDPTIGRRTGVQELLDLEATIATRSGSKRSAEVADNIRRKEVSSTRVLDQVLDYLLPPSYSREQAGSAIKAGTEDVADDPLYSAGRKKWEAAKGDMGAFLEGMGGGKYSDDEVISMLRGHKGNDIFQASGLEGRATELAAAKDAAWNDFEKIVYNESIGGVPVSNVRVPMEGVYQELLKDSQRIVYDTQVYGSPIPKQVYDPLLKIIQDSGGAKGGARPGDMGLPQLVVAIRDLKSRYRDAMGNKDLTPYEEKVIADVTSKLETHMMQYLGRGQHGDIRQAYTNAKEMTKLYEDFAQRTVARDVLAKFGGPQGNSAYTDSGAAAMRKIFAPRTAEHARVVRDAVDGNPDAMDAVKDWLFKDYTTKATKNGIVNPEAHAKWMTDHGEQLRLFIGDEKFAQVGQLGRYASLYREGKEESKKLATLWSQAWGKKVERIDPEAIGQAITGSRLSVGDIRGMTAFLQRNSPETLEQVQEIVKDDLRKRIFKSTQKADVSSAVNDMLTDGSGGFEKLTTIFGPTYTNDLKIVYGELKKWKTLEGKSFGLPTNSTPLTLARVFFGPLSKAQRFLTAGKQWELQGYEKAFLDILTDPNKLHAVITHKDMMAQYEGLGGVMSIIGSELFLDNPELEVPK